MISERLKYLVDKFLDDALDKQEGQELRTALHNNGELHDYLAEMKIVDRIIREALGKKKARGENAGVTPDQSANAAKKDPPTTPIPVINPHLRKPAEKAATAILHGDKMPPPEDIDNDIRKYHTGKNDEAGRIMQHVSDIYFHQRRRRRRNLNLATTAALAAAAVIVIVLLIWTPGKPVNNDKLYASYYAPYHYVVNRASEGSLNLFAQAKVTYNQGHYKQSLAMSRELLGHDPDNAQYRFLLALSLNALGQTREAISQYRSLATDPGPANDRIHNLSSWYLGLCYIKSDNADSARFFLKQTEPLLGRYFLENMRPEEVLKKMGK